jgi:hypothetical protein
VSQSIPALVLVAMALFTDRIMRREVIVDSSSLMSTIFAAHLLNVCRSGMVVVRVIEPRAAVMNGASPLQAAGTGGGTGGGHGGGFMAALSVLDSQPQLQGSASEPAVYIHQFRGRSDEAAGKDLPTPTAAKVRDSQAALLLITLNASSSSSSVATPQPQPGAATAAAVHALDPDIRQQAARMHADVDVMRMLRRTRWWKAPPIPLAWWQEVLLSSAYALASVIMVMGMDAASWLLPRAYRWQVDNRSIPFAAAAANRRQIKAHCREEDGCCSIMHHGAHQPHYKLQISTAVSKLACWRLFHRPLEHDNNSAPGAVARSKGKGGRRRHLADELPSASSNAHMAVCVPTVVAHLVLIIVLVTRAGVPHADVAQFMAASRIMARSFAFLALSLTWSYAFGMWCQSPEADSALPVAAAAAVQDQQAGGGGGRKGARSQPPNSSSSQSSACSQARTGMLSASSSSASVSSSASGRTRGSKGPLLLQPSGRGGTRAPAQLVQAKMRRRPAGRADSPPPPTPHPPFHALCDILSDSDLVVMSSSGSSRRRRRRTSHDDADGSARHNQHSHSHNHHHSPVLPLKCPIASCYVQDFTPCQLRFTVLLLTDGWIMAAAGMLMGMAVAERVYRIACFTHPAAAASDAHASDAADTGDCDGFHQSSDSGERQGCSNDDNGDDGDERNNDDDDAAAAAAAEARFHPAQDAHQDHGDWHDPQDDCGYEHNRSNSSFESVQPMRASRASATASSRRGGADQQSARRQKSLTMTAHEIQSMMLLAAADPEQAHADARPLGGPAQQTKRWHDDHHSGTRHAHAAQMDDRAVGYGGEDASMMHNKNEGGGYDAAVHEEFALALAASDAMSSHGGSARSSHQQQQRLRTGGGEREGALTADEETFAMFARAKEAAGISALPAAAAQQQQQQQQNLQQNLQHSYVARNERLGELI